MDRACFHGIWCVFALLAVPVMAGVNAPTDAPNVVGMPDALKTRREPLVTSEASPSVKAPSTKNIDTAASQPLPADSGRAAGAPVSNVGGMARSSDGPHMKCWQHGRLIVDKRVKVLPNEAPVSGSRVRDAETGAEVVTFDLKNATCVVQ
jgi:hypothetical protein